MYDHGIVGFAVPGLRNDNQLGLDHKVSVFHGRTSQPWGPVAGDNRYGLFTGKLLFLLLRYGHSRAVVFDGASRKSGDHPSGDVAALASQAMALADPQLAEENN